MLQSRLKRILDIYDPNCQYLMEVNHEFPKATGIFKIDKLFYTTESFEHLTAVEAALCLEQLSYACFGEWIPEGRFDRKVGFEEYLKSMREMFVGQSSIEFKKLVFKDKDIRINTKLIRLAQIKETLVGVMDYDIENGKSTGTLKLAAKF